MKVYLLCVCDYSNCEHIAVFSTRQRAQRYRKKHKPKDDYWNIEEIEVNKIPKEPK